MLLSLPVHCCFWLWPPHVLNKLLCKLWAVAWWLKMPLRNSPLSHPAFRGLLFYFAFPCCFWLWPADKSLVCISSCSRSMMVEIASQNTRLSHHSYFPSCHVPNTWPSLKKGLPSSCLVFESIIVHSCRDRYCPWPCQVITCRPLKLWPILLP